jgi:hypothetical protein
MRQSKSSNMSNVSSNAKSINSSNRTLNSNRIMQLQQSVGNQAVLGWLQSMKPTAANNSAPIQRTISVGKEQLFYNDEKEALSALKSSFPSIKPEVLEVILSSFNSDPEYDKFHNFATMKHTIEAAAQWIAQKDNYNVNPNEWGVLHRLKGKLKPQVADLPQTREEGSFKRFIRAQDSTADVNAKQVEYEGTDSRYDPSKFSTDDNKTHSWKSNVLWLQNVMSKFTKMLLTDIPLDPENIKRQSPREYGFSAYAREIAALLRNDYLPVGRKTFQSSTTTQDTVSMIHKDQLPKSIMPVLTQNINVDKTAMLGIYNDDSIRTATALAHFDNAGLPTIITPEKLKKLEKIQKVAPKVEITDNDRVEFLKLYLSSKGCTEIPSDNAFWKDLQVDDKGKVYFEAWGFKRMRAFANVNSWSILN